eukprot:625180-Karenia_brevis.AAC.1
MNKRTRDSLHQHSFQRILQDTCPEFQVWAMVRQGGLIALPGWMQLSLHLPIMLLQAFKC